MDYNIPSWTEEALWKRMSVQEFLNDEKAQELTCLYKITELLKTYTKQNVAAIWLSGQELGKNNAPDANGTTAPVYVARVMRHIE